METQRVKIISHKEPVNYKNLLIRYMRHVKAVESISFIDNHNYDFELTDDEKIELRAIEDYINKLY